MPNPSAWLTEVKTVIEVLRPRGFVIVELCVSVTSEGPYAQVAREPYGWYLEVVSERYLPRDAWPIDELALRRDGWAPPTDVDGNWWREEDLGCATEQIADLVVGGLVRGRCCREGVDLLVTSGRFPTPPDGGEPMRGHMVASVA